MTDRRKFMQGALTFPAVAAGQWSLRAEESWPARTITIVVPFPPGGVADYAARPLAAFLSETLGKNVVVENKGGAGGGIGHAYVARSEPDGSGAIADRRHHRAGDDRTDARNAHQPLAAPVLLGQRFNLG